MYAGMAGAGRHGCNTGSGRGDHATGALAHTTCTRHSYLAKPSISISSSASPVRRILLDFIRSATLSRLHDYHTHGLRSIGPSSIFLVSSTPDRSFRPFLVAVAPAWTISRSPAWRCTRPSPPFRRRSSQLLPCTRTSLSAPGVPMPSNERYHSHEHDARPLGLGHDRRSRNIDF